MMTTRMILKLLVAIGAIALAAGVASAKAPWEKIKIPELDTFEMPAYERVELPSGMVLYLAEDHFVPMIELSAQIMVGSIYEDADKVGLAAMAGSVLRTGGAGERSGDEIDSLVEARGMDLETWVGQTTGGAYLSCLTEDIDLGLALLADVLMRPRFADDKIELAKQMQKAAIARRNDEPLSIAMRELPKVLFGADHPLARHPEYASIAAVTRANLQEFHDAYFHPERMYLVVIGDFAADEMAGRIEAAFAGWPAAPAPLPADPEIPRLPRTVNVAAKDGLSQATVLLGHKGIRNDDPDYAAIQVAAEILGGGFNSRLFKEIRSNRGLAYSVGSSPGTGWRYPGAFLAYTMTRNDAVEAAAKGILGEIDKMLNEPVTEDELQAAKDLILNSEVFNYDTKREVLDRLVLFEMYGYAPDFLQTYQEAVKALTPAAMQAACQRVWKPAELSVLVVGTPSEFDGDLSTFGPVNQIDITIPAPKATLVIPEATAESLAQGKARMLKLRDRTGGKAFANVKGWHESSEMTVQTQMGALAITIDQTVQLPDHLRIVTKLPFGEQVQVVAGDQGWAVGMGQQKDLTAGEVAELRKAIDQETFGILRRVDELEFQALAPLEVGGKLCNPVVVEFDDEATIMYLDAETDLLVMVQSPATSPMTGSPVTQKVYVQGYQDLSGFTLPGTLKITHDDEDFADVTVKSFEVNPAVDPALFEK
ncbi:MAG TPA: pitrilysin family protein [Candidatus Krumholzibacteria bacterium]|nr:pitrilysin family protein [Candidatus Krumholzibacteria bacterium]HPD72155.1 pitrilysin family protein [Candidatus Krumholzibacteria bacterium]HRY40913.1 pitrilysin family protein [Candidatus Krumholzibacteria bacterium]